MMYYLSNMSTIHTVELLRRHTLICGSKFIFATKWKYSKTNTEKNTIYPQCVKCMNTYMCIGRHEHTHTHAFTHLSFQFPYPAEYDDWVWTDLQAEDEAWLYVCPSFPSSFSSNRMNLKDW